eukprot:UN24255
MIEIMADAKFPAGYKFMVYGVSYGTYWGQRLLQVFEQDSRRASINFTNIVLDGVCAPELTRLLYYDNAVNMAGNMFLSECGKDPTCNKNLGQHPLFQMHLFHEFVMAGRLECAKKVSFTLNNDFFVNFGGGHYGRTKTTFDRSNDKKVLTL